MTTDQILAIAEAAFTGYTRYQQGGAVTIPPQEVDFAGTRAAIGLVIQKASGNNAPTTRLQYNSTADLFGDLETAFTDYEHFQAGQPVNVPPIAVPFGGDQALLSFSIQRIQTASATAPSVATAPAPAAPSPQAIRASLGGAH